MGESVSWNEMRAADSDRQRVAERLGRAQADGRLSMSEYDTRLRDALAARTYGELDRLTKDLPEPSGGVAPQDEPGQDLTALSGRDVAERAGGCPPQPRKSDLRRAAETWATYSAVAFSIWLVGIIAGSGALSNPWWLWVAGPWGAVILVMALSGAGKRYSD